jgi:hypothetical protein
MAPVDPCAWRTIQRQRTTQMARPSWPLTPTRWRKALVSRGWVAARSVNRCTPVTAGSSDGPYATAPPRTTLSATVTVPGWDSRSAASRYSAYGASSASMERWRTARTCW